MDHTFSSLKTWNNKTSNFAFETLPDFLHSKKQKKT